MKKLTFRLLLAAVASIALALPQKADAQQYSILTLTGTNNMPALTTNNLALTGNLISLPKYDSCGLLVKFEAQSASTANAYFVFRYSLDGTTNFSTAAANQFTIVAAATGTTSVNVVTNLPAVMVGGIGYISLDSIGNQSATVAITNVTVSYSVKPKRQG